MKTNHVVELLHDYVDGELTPSQRVIVEHHMNECADCRDESVRLQELVASLNSLPKSIEPPADVLDGLSDRLPFVLENVNLAERRNGQAIRETKSSSRYLRAAAILLVVLGSGIALWMMSREPEPIRQTANSNLNLQNVEKSKPGNSSTAKTTEKEEKNVGLKKARESESASTELISKLPVMNESEDIRIPSRILDTIATALSSTSQRLRLPQHSSEPARHGLVSIRGTVVDAVTGESLIGAVVTLDGTSFGAATNIQGIFEIRNVPPGTYTLNCSFIGYKRTMLANVRVLSDSTTTLNSSLKLNSENIAMSEVTVTAERPLVDRSMTRSSQTIVSQAGVVASGNEQFIRGGRANEVAYFLDGVAVADNEFNTEQYNHIVENEFRDAFSNPLSTFSIDVDNASYSNIRRFINGGQLPPIDAVRIEEMINYFTYDYPQPKGSHPFSITTELGACPWNSSNQLLLVGLQGKNVATEDLPPSNLVFLLDVSGSMNEPNKLPLVKSAFRLLVNQLRKQDRVSIVVYAGSSGLVLPSTSGSEKEKILDAIERLQAGGSTAGAAGIVLAYQVAKENFIAEGNNRVILATDGDFNVGVSSDGELVRLIEEKRKDGVFLSVLGFGDGNLKDSKMEQLADKGNGNYAYIDNIQEARKVFVGQMAGTLFTIAKDVKIQIEFNPLNVKSYRLVGYENRLLAKEDFSNDKKDAGELGSGHSVTALYEIVPANGDVELHRVDSLKYQLSQPSSRFASELLTLKLRYKMPKDTTSKLIVQTCGTKSEALGETSRNFQFASSVGQFGLLLRDSKFKAAASYERVLSIARESKGDDPEGYRSEFLRLVEAARTIPRR